MRHSIWIFVLLAVFVGVFTPAFAGGSEPTTFSVANEATTISTTNWTSVDEDGQRYFDNETVYDNGSVVEESEYHWSTDNGSIKAVEGGALDDASRVEIYYSGEKKNQWSRLLIPMLLLIFTVFGVFLLWIGGDVIVDAIGSGGGR
jgi:hypothetical protein